MTEPASCEENNIWQEDSDEVGAAAFETEEVTANLEENNAWQKYCDEVEEAALKSFVETVEHTDEVRENESNGEEDETADNYDREAEKQILANLKDEAETDNEAESQSSLVKLNKVKFGTIMSPINCAECGNTFKTYKSLQEHIKIIHSKVTEIPCDKCSKVFSTKSNLKHHQQRVHSTVTEYVCLVCSKGCVTKAELVVHMKYHTKEKSFVCDRDGCSFTSFTNADLKAHKNQHDGIMLTCDHCGKLFSAMKYLNYHIKHVHLKVPSRKTERRREQAGEKGVPPKAPPPTIEEKTCPECGKVFKKPSLMKRHMVVHQNGFACMRDLQQHVNSFYAKTDCGTRLKCIDCGKEFAFHKNLKEHVLNMHIRERDDSNWQTIIDPVDGSPMRVKLPQDNKLKDLIWSPYIAESKCGKPKCNKCGNKFSCMRNLKEHVRNVHILKENKDALKPTEEEIKFSADLCVQFSGRRLVQVLDMVRTLKECGKTEVLERIREAGKEGGCRAAFEEMGAFENLEKQEPYDDKEAKLEVKVDPKDLNWEDEIKEEPESDSEEAAEIPFFEETYEDNDNLIEPQVYRLPFMNKSWRKMNPNMMLR